MTREQGGGSFFQRLREWLAGLLAPGAASGSRRQGRGTGVTPETVRPLTRPTSLGPKATVVEAVAQGQKYFLKTWTDLPADGRRELLRLLETRRALNGPGVVDVLAVSEKALERHSGIVQCVQEHHPRTLRAWRSSMTSEIGLEQAAAVVRQIARTLQEAHARSVVHGSLSPDSIFVASAEGDDPGTISIDFVRFTGLDLTRNPAFTIAEVFPTGRSYVAPEALLGNPPDEQSDLYVLGVIAYEVFTGRLPFDSEGTSGPGRVKGMLSAQAQPITRYRKDLPNRWEVTLMRLLSKDRKIRCKTAEQFLLEVESEL